MRRLVERYRGTGGYQRTSRLECPPCGNAALVTKDKLLPDLCTGRDGL